MHCLAAVVAAAVLAALGAPLRAQATARLVQDLGDPQRSEAAERELLALGAAAAKALEPLLAEWDEAPRELDRRRAALRVLGLLGPEAGELADKLVEMIKSERQTLRAEVLQALGSLQPGAAFADWHHVFHYSLVHTRDADKPVVFPLLVRLNARATAKVDSVDAALRLLERDGLFEREAAAEALGRHGDPRGIEPLQLRLRERDRPPRGHEQIRHNGIAVPVQDQFALAAGLALVRLAGDDPRSAIGHAQIALHHPHPSRRRDALRALLSFGPAAEDAVPELVQLATGRDAEAAAEALKALGMAGRAAAPHLPALAALAAERDGAVQRLAAGLVARLRAMGCTEPPPDPAAAAAAAQRARLQQAARTLTDAGAPADAEALAALRAGGAAAVPFLLQRFAADRAGTPECLLELLGELGRSLPEAARQPLRYALGATGETWSSDRMSSQAGANHSLTPARQVAYGELLLGDEAAPAALAERLADPNPLARWAAARRLAARGEPLPAADAAAVAAALRAALADPHPDRADLEIGPTSRSGVVVALGREIQAAAAVACCRLLAPGEHAAAWLTQALGHRDAAAVAAAVRAAGPQAGPAVLDAAAADGRQVVREAAAAARRDTGTGR